MLCATVGLALRDLLALVPIDRRDGLALSLSRSLVETQQRKLAISDTWNAWLASANRSTLPKEKTLGGYRGIWTQFAAWAEKRGLSWLHELAEADAMVYADHLWSSNVTPRTFTAHIRFLKSVWSTLRIAGGLTEANPWSGVKSKALAADSGRRDLTPDELRMIIQAATGSLRLILLAGALTGARLGDIANMQWDDLDLNAGEWNFMPMKTSRTGKRLRLPLLQPLLDGLRSAAVERSGLNVFPAEQGLWQRGDLTKRMSRHFESCGIATQAEEAEGQRRKRARVLVGFHSLRHTAATLAAKSGANLALVQKTLGHATAGMTAHYTHGDIESARTVLGPLAEALQLPTGT